VTSPALPGFVYAIQASSERRYVKLGLSSNPRARLSKLQQGNPRKMSIIWTFEVENMATSEVTLHEAFSPYRADGEWFDFHPIAETSTLQAWLELMALRHLVPGRFIPHALFARLANIDSLIASPEQFMRASLASESLARSLGVAE
jgi:hypothetical protein